MSDELIHHMRGFAEECLRRIELNPEVSGNELHTKQTYVDIMKLCDRVPAAPQSDPLTKEAEASGCSRPRVLRPGSREAR